MRRVRFLHAARMIMTPAMLRAVVFLASVVSTIAVVSVSSVIDNMSRLDARAYGPYIVGAFMHTGSWVKAFIVVALAVGVWLTIDIVRNVRYAGAALRRSFRSA